MSRQGAQKSIRTVVGSLGAQHICVRALDVLNVVDSGAEGGAS